MIAPSVAVICVLALWQLVVGIVETKELPEFAHLRADAYRLIKREGARVAQ